jgi:Transposase DDE domain
MRHGRKTKTRPFIGFKRHVIKLVDADLIVDAVVCPANEPEHATLARLTPAVTALGPLDELLIDCGYLGSPAIAPLHAAGVNIRAKAWTSTNRGRFPKPAFTLDLAAAQATCPAGQTARFAPGATAIHFPATTCLPCALRARCTTAARGGRSVALHPQEALLQQLRHVQQHPDGRLRLRARTTVEHSLARVQQIQDAKARYKGLRKNTLDARRVAAVVNLQRVARLPVAA